MAGPKISYIGDFGEAETNMSIVRGDGSQDRWHVPAEVPTAFMYNNRNHAVMMASPTDLADFAVGFSLTEQICRSLADILAIDVHATKLGIECRLKISSQAAERLDVQSNRRAIEGRSGCGVCGLATADSIYRRLPEVAKTRETIAATSIEKAFTSLKQFQPLNAMTHSVHAAAWVNKQGEILHVREDVGRHNALDKLLGALTLNEFDPHSGFVLMSSRCSYELVQKAALMGIQILATVSGPTEFALQKAAEANMSLVGFDRGTAVFLSMDKLT